MARRARRYDGESKLNVKKIIAVIVFILVIAMFIVGIKFLLNNDSENTSGRIGTITYYTIYDNGKWGVLNSNGEIVIDATYDEMIVIPDSTQAIFICTYDVNYEDGTYKTKVIDSKEKEIIEGYEKIEAIANYDNNQNIWYENNVLRVQKEGLYGLVDYSGKEILSCEYNSIEPIIGIKNSIIIEKDGLYGLCDATGNIIIEPNYKRIDKIGDNYENGYIVVDENDKYGIIGIDKSIVLECQYEEVKGVYANNLFAVKQNGKYVIIDGEGQTILENNFDDVTEINGDYIVAKKDGKSGIIDINGDTKVDFEYDELIFMNTNYYVAKKGDRYGVIDIDGTEKLPFECIDISYVNSGDFIIADYIENRNSCIKSIRLKL